MRIRLLIGIACLLSACGGGTSDGDGDGGTDAGDGADAGGDPAVIRTGQACKAPTDCTMNPGRNDCPEERKAVRYEPVCGGDQRCVWERLEDRCSFRCEDGYCLSGQR